MQVATVLVLGEAMKRIYRYVVLCLSLVACLGLAAQAQDEPREQHVGRVQDWTYSHVTMSGGLRSADLARAKTEPRMLFRLVERNLSASGKGGRFGRGGRDPRRPIRPQSAGLKIDWSIPLGSGIVAPNMFPAKYSFDITAAPSCANDYVVYGLNVAGATPGQANLVGVLICTADQTQGSAVRTLPSTGHTTGAHPVARC